MMDALDAGAKALGLELGRFCGDIAFPFARHDRRHHTIIQKKGARVGLNATRGHEDAIHIRRGSRGYSGRDIRKVVHFPRDFQARADRAQAPDPRGLRATSTASARSSQR